MDLIPVYIVVTFLIIFALLIILRKTKQDKETDEDDTQTTTTNNNSGQSASELYKGYIADTYILEAQPDFIAKLSYKQKEAKHYLEIDYYRSRALYSANAEPERDNIFKYKGQPKFYASKDKETDPRLVNDWQEFKDWQADNSKTVKWYDETKRNIINFRSIAFYLSLPVNTIWVKVEFIVNDEIKFAYAHLIP